MRDYTTIVRDWLGINPETGEDHLPYADNAPGTKITGVNVYQVDDGLLIDLDLFLRLRKRGQARGSAEASPTCAPPSSWLARPSRSVKSGKKDGNG